MASHRKRMPASSSDHTSGEWNTYRPTMPAKSTAISANTRSAAGIAVKVKSAVFVRATQRGQPARGRSRTTSDSICCV